MTAHPSTGVVDTREAHFVAFLKAYIAESERSRDRPAHPWMKEHLDRNRWYNGAIAAAQSALREFQEVYGLPVD